MTRRSLYARRIEGPVVESSGFNDQTYLDGEGLPHSEGLRMADTELMEHLCENEKDLVNMYRK